MAHGPGLYAELNTPAVLIDLTKLEGNIREMTDLAAGARVKLRPHTKVHQCPEIAKMQIDAGACGIEVGTVEQAEVMVREGVKDIIVAHPFVGDHKRNQLERLLSDSGVHLGVVVDMMEQAEPLSMIGRRVGRNIGLHLKIDTGINRYGVLPGRPALDLARALTQLPGVELCGLYAHESGADPTEEGVRGMASQVASTMCDLAGEIRREGIRFESVSVGASPTYRATCQLIKEGKFPEITEIHPGQCVIGDLLYMKALGNTREACALSVLTTAMSTSHSSHAVIDAGYKTFGADSMIGYRETPGFFWQGYPSFGSVESRPDLWIGRLGAETAWVFYKDPAGKVNVGDRFQIVPNNATLVLNLHDEAYGVRNGRVERILKITGRGCGS